MRHHRNKICFKLFNLLKKFILLNVFPASSVFDNKTVRNKEVVTQEYGEQGVGKADPDVENT